MTSNDQTVLNSESPVFVNPDYPIVRHEDNNFQIIDLHRNHYDEVLNFLEINFIRKLILFKNLFKYYNLKNKNNYNSMCMEIINEYRQLLKFMIGNDVSLVAIDRKKNKICGVMVNLLMVKRNKSWVMWSCLAEGGVIALILDIERIIVKESVEKLGFEKPRDSLHVCIMSIAKQYKGNLLKVKFLNAAEKLAKLLRVPYLTYVSFTQNDHERAMWIGMKEIEKFDIEEIADDSIFARDLPSIKKIFRNINQPIYHELEIITENLNGNKMLNSSLLEDQKENY